MGKILEERAKQILEEAQQLKWPEDNPEFRKFYEQVTSDFDFISQKVQEYKGCIGSLFYTLNHLGLNLSPLAYSELSKRSNIYSTFILPKIKDFIRINNSWTNPRNKVLRAANLMEASALSYLQQVAYFDLLLAENNHDLGNTISLYGLMQFDFDEPTIRRISADSTHLSNLGLGGVNILIFGHPQKTCFSSELVLPLSSFFKSHFPNEITLEDKCADVKAQLDMPNFYRVGYNLIRNSLLRGKASKVRISAAQQGDHVSIEFADNGIGLPNEDSVFDLGTSYAGSTGLGLFMAKRIVEAHRGNITAKSHGDDPEYNGAVFTINLPTEQRNSPLFYPSDF